MNAHRVVQVIGQDGKLLLQDLPFEEGDTVEVIILEVATKSRRKEVASPYHSSNQKPSMQDLYPLRGKPIEYTHPTQPVAQDEWSVLE